MALNWLSLTEIWHLLQVLEAHGLDWSEARHEPDIVAARDAGYPLWEVVCLRSRTLGPQDSAALRAAAQRVTQIMDRDGLSAFESGLPEVLQSSISPYLAGGGRIVSLIRDISAMEGTIRIVHEGARVQIVEE